MTLDFTKGNVKNFIWDYGNQPTTKQTAAVSGFDMLSKN